MTRILGLAAAMMMAMAGCSSQPEPAPAQSSAVVVLETTMGNIAIQLDGDKAPISVKNFLQYVDDGHYNGTIFHRVKADFMIQGGGMTPDGQEKATRPPIRNEGGNGLRNVRGTLAMARTGQPDSATSQFFINVVDNAGLDRDQCADGVGYAVFGKVIDGMDVVDKIRQIPTHVNPANPRDGASTPDKPVILLKAHRK